MPDIYKALEAIARRAAKDARIAAPTASADDVIADMALLLPWEPDNYTVGDVRVHGGQPWRCCQAHDGTDQGDTWAPGVAHSLWAPYHATSAKWALPYVAPTGAHDAYQADEYMRWTNGGLYLCKQDNTVWSPAELPEAWELAEAAI
jgi:hypothetical protein|nr:MAG TPA: Chitin oligosaccharide deacetylase [Caudoviricetes sp.]